MHSFSTRFDLDAIRNHLLAFRRVPVRLGRDTPQRSYNYFCFGGRGFAMAHSMAFVSSTGNTADGVAEASAGGISEGSVLIVSTSM